MFELLPSELWTNILLQLPVRSLNTLKCVSKVFLSFIQNPNFDYLHFSRVKNPNPDPDLLLLEFWSDWELLVCRGNTRDIILEAQIDKDEIDDIMSYVDGMLWVFRFCTRMNNSILLNPSIKKSMLIPPCPAANESGPLAAGFGYDPVANDYKAAVLVFPTTTTTRPGFIRVHVYSLKIGSWRTSRTDSIPFCLDSRRNVYANGAIHWMARDHEDHADYLEDEDDEYYYSHIVSFDLGTGGFRFRLLPGGFFGEAIRVPMSFHGSFAVLYISNSQICVWVLAEVGWNKQCEVQSSSDFYGYLFEVGHYGRFNSAILSEENDELLIAMNGDVNVDGLISYNIKTQQFKSLHQGVSVRLAEMYVESLFWRELLPDGE